MYPFMRNQKNYQRVREVGGKEWWEKQRIEKNEYIEDDKKRRQSRDEKIIELLIRIVGKNALCNVELVLSDCKRGLVKEIDIVSAVSKYVTENLVKVKI